MKTGDLERAAEIIAELKRLEAVRVEMSECRFALSTDTLADVEEHYLDPAARFRIARAIDAELYLVANDLREELAGFGVDLSDFPLAPLMPVNQP